MAESSEEGYGSKRVILSMMEYIFILETAVIQIKAPE
jgi:hypothetical protein